MGQIPPHFMPKEVRKRCEKHPEEGREGAKSTAAPEITRPKKDRKETRGESASRSAAGDET